MSQRQEVTVAEKHQTHASKVLIKPTSLKLFWIRINFLIIIIINILYFHRHKKTMYGMRHIKNAGSQH